MSMNPLLPDARPGPKAVDHYGGFGSTIHEELSMNDVSRVLRRQRPMILWSILAGLGLALLVSLLMTPNYRSVAHVELKSTDGNKLGLSDFSPESESGADDLGTNVSTLTEMLHSDGLAMETIQQNNLEAVDPYKTPKNGKFASEAELPLADAPLRRIEVLKRFKSNLNVKPLPGTRLVQISFDDRDPKRSAAVVNSLIGIYISDYIARHYSSAVQASDWLQKQISDLKQQVAVSNKQVTDFEKENGFFGFVGTGSDNAQNPLLQKLVALNQSVVQAQSERIQKEAVVKLLATRDPELIVGLGSNPQVLNGVAGTDLAVLQSLRLQEAQLKAQYSDMESKYGSRYPTLVETKSQMASIQSSITRAVDNLRSRAENDYSLSAKNESMLKQTFDENVAEANKLNDKATQFQLLSKEAEGNRTLYEGLRTKLREAEVAASVRGANITVVDRALPMPTPSSPNYPLNLSLGLGAGLLFGLGAAFYRNRGDHTLETVEAMEAVSPVPILGAVPSLTRLKQASSPRGLASSVGRVINGHSQRIENEDRLSLEAYRQIRASILINTAGAALRTILVTSPMNGDGKSNSVIELASAFAFSGARVLALDSDLRRAEVDARSGKSTKKGLSDLLAGEGEANDFIQPHSSVANLFLLPSGSSLESPLLLIESPRFKQLLENLKKNFDFILIDSPPVSFFADVSVMAPMMDATVLVVRAGITPKQAFQRSCRALLDSGSKLLGVIVNDVALDSSNFYGYYGYHGKDSASSYAKN
jgi:succinoglycan biosynthesis transport protein ExoP